MLCLVLYTSKYGDATASLSLFSSICVPYQQKNIVPFYLFVHMFQLMFITSQSTACISKKSLTPPHLHPLIRYSQTGIRPPPRPTHLIFSLNKLSLFNLSLSISLDPLCILCWTCSVIQWFSCIGEPQPGHNTPDIDPQVLD